MCATLLTCSVSAHASLVLICGFMPTEDCDVDQDCGLLYEERPSSCDPYPENCPFNPIACNAATLRCTTTNNYSCSYQDVVATPTTIYRSFNGSKHAYTASLVPPSGYELDGVAFNMANDSYGGALPFSADSGTVYYYPPDDTSALAADPDLVPLYRFYNPTYGDMMLTTDPNEAQYYPCTSGYCAFYAPNGPCVAPVPPNCYFQMEPVYGYGG